MGLEQKICIITGATDGIGKETACQLAKLNYDIYIIARNEQKCITTIGELKSINNKNKYGYFIADFEHLDEVKNVALKIKNELPIIDVLINNAGAVFAKRELTKDGFEKTFVVNHLAPFLLTNILIENIKQAKQGRIVNVASDSHYPGKLDFDDLHYNKNYFILKAYERSKLANVLFSNYLAKELSTTNVTVNSLHPGRVKSDIGSKNTNNFFSFAWKVIDTLTGIPTADGAKTSVFLASSATLENISGKYFDKCVAKKPSSLAQNEALAEKLWNVSKQMLVAYL
jgi:NAD(P)-dependent dehydrogenase (short-subunit alcohol dehydrogenase family)